MCLCNEVSPFCPLSEVRLHRSTVIGIMAAVHCTDNKGVHYVEVTIYMFNGNPSPYIDMICLIVGACYL